MKLLSASAARSMSHPEKLPSRPFWPAARTQSLLDLLGPLDANGASSTPIPRLQVEWNRVLTAPASYTIKGPISPFKIPETYGDPAGQAAALAIVDDDFNTCADLAMRWHFRGDSAAAAKAVAIIQAWSGITVWDASGGATTPLVWASRAPKLIQAAFLLKNYSGYTNAVDTAFRALLTRSVAAKASPSYQYSNNVGVWGLVYDIACAKFLNNRAELNRAITLWRRFFNENIKGDVPIGEVYRQASEQGDGSYGLWYSNFLLYAFTIAAEWARYSGEWLYDHVAPDGSSFKGLAMQVRYWTRYPDRFPYNSSGTPSQTVRSLPHDEILHALWPTVESAWILASFPNGSDRDSHGVRGSVLIYRDRPLHG